MAGGKGALKSAVPKTVRAQACTLLGDAARAQLIQSAMAGVPSADAACGVAESFKATGSLPARPAATPFVPGSPHVVWYPDRIEAGPSFRTRIATGWYPRTSITT